MHGESVGELPITCSVLLYSPPLCVADIATTCGPQAPYASAVLQHGQQYLHPDVFLQIEHVVHPHLRYHAGYERPTIEHRNLATGRGPTAAMPLPFAHPYSRLRSIPLAGSAAAIAVDSLRHPASVLAPTHVSTRVNEAGEGTTTPPINASPLFTNRALGGSCTDDENQPG